MKALKTLIALGAIGTVAGVLSIETYLFTGTAVAVACELITYLAYKAYKEVCAS